MKAKLCAAVAAMTTIGSLGLGAAGAEAGGATHVRSTGSWVVNGTVAPNPAAGIDGDVNAVVTPSDHTVVRLHVSGLPANRTFGAHVHQLPCATNFGGTHYRNDPSAPASPENEVWLDFTTDDTGTATAVSQVPWVVGHSGIAPSETASSVVVHDHATNDAGVAGPKLACIGVPFSS